MGGGNVRTLFGPVENKKNKMKALEECLGTKEDALWAFFPEIKEVGFSLDYTPGLPSSFRHFAVTPPRFSPRPRGSIHLAFKPPTVPSNWGSAFICETRFPVHAALGPRRPPKSPTQRLLWHFGSSSPLSPPHPPPSAPRVGRNVLQTGVAPTGSPRPLGISGYWTPSI